MARRKAPQRRRQEASKGSLGKKADQEPAAEAAGPSCCQTSRYEVGCSCPGRQVRVVAGTRPNMASVARSSMGKLTEASEEEPRGLQSPPSEGMGLS